MDTTNVTEEKDTIQTIIRAIKRSFSFAWQHEKKDTLLMIVLSVVAAVVPYLQLTSFSKIINEIVSIQKNGGIISHALLQQSLLLAIFFLVPTIIENIKDYSSGKLHVHLRTHLDIYGVDKFSKLDIGTVEGSVFQKKLEFAQQWGIGSIRNIISYTLRTFQQLVGIITSAVIMFSISPLLVLVAVVGGVPRYFIARKHGVHLFKAYNEQTDDLRTIGDRRSFFTTPKKLIEVLSFGISSLFRKQIQTTMDRHGDQIIRITKRKVAAEFWQELLSAVLLIVAIGIIVSQTLTGHLLVGALFLAFTTYRAFTNNTNDCFYSLSLVEDQARYATRWFDLFDIQPMITSKPRALVPQWDTPPKIEFKDVDFAYPETSSLVLKNINITIESGEKVALVGLNGAGKTTFVKLLCRIYEPTKGKILLNDINIQDIDLEYLRSNFGILFQDFSNFQMTVREAIAIARPNDPVDEEKVKWAADVSGASEFITRFPKGFDQMLWKGFQDGIELSKGQFQRMAVARIFYRDAFISVLDEPTAAIDAVAEEKIFESLESKMQGKTVVLISHRFSTVKNADKIAVIEHGELKELGNHKDLMKKAGRYAELYTMQANRYLEEK